MLVPDLRNPTLTVPGHYVPPMPAGYPPGPIRYEAAGTCHHEDTDAYLLVDSSGSVTAHNGWDPLGFRFTENYLALDHIRRWSCLKCRRRGAITVTVVHFTPGLCDVTHVPLHAAGLAIIGRALVVPPGGTCSELRPSLDVVEALAAERPDHRAVVVPQTDWELFDSPPAYERLRQFPGAVHAIGLAHRVPDELADDPRITSTTVTYASAPGAIARPIAAAVTTIEVVA